MTSLNTFLVWLLAVFLGGPTDVDTPDAEFTAPPSASSFTETDEEEQADPDWVEIQRRLLSNGKNGIFNGV